MQTQDIRRRENGTIDIDYYRQEALSHRREVMTSFFRRAGRAARPLIAITAVALAVHSFATRPPSTESDLRSSQDVRVLRALTPLPPLEPI
jgi:hypothetical protein